MSGLGSLYQEMILEHSKAPRNNRVVEPHTHHAEGYNPLCGDQCDITLRMEDGRIADVAFTGAGCAISTASASLMTQAVTGKTLAEAEHLFAAVRNLVTTEGEPSDDLGKLQVFAGVRQFPMRVKCATLSWHTLLAALRGEQDAVTTE